MGRKAEGGRKATLKMVFYRFFAMVSRFSRFFGGVVFPVMGFSWSKST